MSQLLLFWGAKVRKKSLANKELRFFINLEQSFHFAAAPRPLHAEQL